jgi:hypothetical protein
MPPSCVQQLTGVKVNNMHSVMIESNLTNQRNHAKQLSNVDSVRHATENESAENKTAQHISHLVAV